jgi:hypothetical protein
MTFGYDLRAWDIMLWASLARSAAFTRVGNGSDWSTVVTVSTATQYSRLLSLPLGYPGYRPQQYVAKTTDHFSVVVYYDGV